MNKKQRQIQYIQYRLKQYKSLECDLRYYENKMKNLKSITFDIVKTTNSKKDINIDYIQKMDDIKQNMANIIRFIEKIFNGKERLVLWYRYIDGLSLKEIAQAMGYSITTVKRFETQALDRFIDERVTDHEKQKRKDKISQSIYQGKKKI